MLEVMAGRCLSTACLPCHDFMQGTHLISEGKRMGSTMFGPERPRPQSKEIELDTGRGDMGEYI